MKINLHVWDLKSRATLYTDFPNTAQHKITKEAN